MSEELLPSRVEMFCGYEQITADARDLHAFLGVKKDFPTWIKAQVKRARLVENKDFIVYHQVGENPQGGRPSIDYRLTSEAAKQIAMMSATAKGVVVRDYFIECERLVFRALPQLPNPWQDKHDQAASTLALYAKFAEYFGAPKHIMMIEANKELGKIGIDTTPFLLASPAMEDVKLTEEYLEPTELGRRWKMSGAEMNKTLESLGLQARVNKEWIPTDKAHGMCTKHAWSVKSKNGYNLKWNVAKVEAMITNYQLGILSPDLMIDDDDLILDDDSI